MIVIHWFGMQELGVCCMLHAACCTENSRNPNQIVEEETSNECIRLGEHGNIKSLTLASSLIHPLQKNHSWKFGNHITFVVIR